VKLPPEIQQIFVYFVMAFPAVIVLLFFFVLYYKNIVLYAPSDFENQRHYLEANEIKQSLNFEIDKVFSDLNKEGKGLTKSQINKARSRLERSVETTISLSPKEKELFDFICASPVTFTEITNKIEISISSLMKYLKSMESRGLIRKVAQEKNIDASMYNEKWCVNV
jgi:predicted HTH transcriptional regulator